MSYEFENEESFIREQIKFYCTDAYLTRNTYISKRLKWLPSQEEYGIPLSVVLDILKKRIPHAIRKAELILREEFVKTDKETPNEGSKQQQQYVMIGKRSQDWSLENARKLCSERTIVILFKTERDEIKRIQLEKAITLHNLSKLFVPYGPIRHIGIPKDQKKMWKNHVFVEVADDIAARIAIHHLKNSRMKININGDKTDLILTPLNDSVTSSSSPSLSNTMVYNALNANGVDMIENVMTRKEWESTKDRLNKFRSISKGSSITSTTTTKNNNISSSNDVNKEPSNKRDGLLRNFKVSGIGDSCVLHPSHTIGSVIEGYSPIAWSRTDKPNASEFYFRVEDNIWSRIITCNMKAIGVMPYNKDSNNDHERDPIIDILQKYIRGSDKRKSFVPRGLSDAAIRLQYCGNGKIEIEPNKDLSTEN